MATYLFHGIRTESFMDMNSRRSVVSAGICGPGPSLPASDSKCSTNGGRKGLENLAYHTEFSTSITRRSTST